MSSAIRGHNILRIEVFLNGLNIFVNYSSFLSIKAAKNNLCQKNRQIFSSSQGSSFADAAIYSKYRDIRILRFLYCLFWWSILPNAFFSCEDSKL